MPHDQTILTGHMSSAGGSELEPSESSVRVLRVGRVARSAFEDHGTVILSCLLLQELVTSWVKYMNYDELI